MNTGENNSATEIFAGYRIMKQNLKNQKRRLS